MGNKEVFAKNLRTFMTSSGKDRKEIAKALGVPYSTLTDWANARKYPRINSIEKMAQYFGVTKSELIEDFEAKQKDNDTLATLIVKIRMNDDLLDIVDKIVSLDKTQINSLKNLLDTFV